MNWMLNLFNQQKNSFVYFTNAYERIKKFTLFMVYTFYDLETGVEKIERRCKLTVSQTCSFFVGQWHLLLKTLKHNFKTIASGTLLWLGCSKSFFFLCAILTPQQKLVLLYVWYVTCRLCNGFIITHVFWVFVNHGHGSMSGFDTSFGSISSISCLP